MSKKQIIGGISGIVLGIIVAFIAPPQGLTPQAMYALGIITWAVVYWICDVAPEYVVAMAMCTLWALFGCVPFKTAFATFSGTVWWLLVGALGMGLAVSRSGLLRRISLWVMNIFPATFNGQTLGLIAAGTIIAPLIPSMTAKAAIVAPISMGISDAMGYKRKSSGAAGLFGAMYVGFILTGPMFISASFICYMLRGLLPADVQAQFNWTFWFISAGIWTITVLVLMSLAIRLLYKPKEKDILPKGYAAGELAKLGPMNRNEKITTVVLVIALLCWMTEPLHGINATIIALVGLIVLLGCRVYDRPDFRTGMGWDNIIFIGGIINLGSVLPALKIDKWIADACSPVITPLISNIYLFIIVLAVAIYAIRYLLVSFTATTAIFTVLFVPFAVRAGINPWVTGFAVWTSTQLWNVFYQNSTFLTSFYAVGGEMVTHKQMARLSYAFMGVSLIGLLASVPLWRYLGLVP